MQIDMKIKQLKFTIFCIVLRSFTGLPRLNTCSTSILYFLSKTDQVRERRSKTSRTEVDNMPGSILWEYLPSKLLYISIRPYQSKKEIKLICLKCKKTLYIYMFNGIKCSFKLGRRKFFQLSLSKCSSCMNYKSGMHPK